MTTRPGPVSGREAEVLAAVGAHLTNAEIASKLFISIRTVESHVSSLLRKYGVADRRALAALAGPAAADPVAPTGAFAGLPVSRTTFVGRADERSAVIEALAADRMVTLVGPGGVGKTRLAAVIADAVAPSFPFGGAFVDLVPARDGFVTQAVAAVLGVAERAQESLADAVVERLQRGRSLLVLDNCEHLIDAAAAFVERVLDECPATTVLATSRERLGVSGERIVPVAPLPLVVTAGGTPRVSTAQLHAGRTGGQPEYDPVRGLPAGTPSENLHPPIPQTNLQRQPLASDAELLFRDRAGAADPDFAADPAVVAELCARLDGMPLAIELAAARSASLGAAGLLSGLDDTLRLVAGGRGPDERHRSLRAVIEWSYRLLDDDERALFRRLAVFVGGFDLDAVVAVGGTSRGTVADLLGRLVDKSLVVRRRTGGWRLLETVRAFAVDQLAAGPDRDEVRSLHLGWAAATAAALEQRITGADWLHGFDAAVDDLRVALSAAPPGPDATVHQLASSLGRLCFARRFLVESLGHYRTAAQRAPTPGERAADLRNASCCAHVATASALSFRLLQEAGDAARAAGDATALAITLARVVELADRFHTFFDTALTDAELAALLAEASAAGDRRRPRVAAALVLAEAWRAGPAKMVPDAVLAEAAATAARVTGDPVLVSAALDAVSAAATHKGHLGEAHRITTERMQLLPAMDRTDPASAPEIEDAYHAAAICAIAAGDLPTAVRIAEAVRDDELIGEHPFISASNVVPALVLTGDLAGALRSAATMWEFWEREGRPAAAWMVVVVEAAALGDALRGDDAGLARWRARTAEVAAASCASESRDLAPFAAFVDARAAVHLGAPPHAAALVGRAFADFRDGRYWPYAHAAGAELAVVAGLPDAADRVAAAADAAAENAWAAAAVARATGRLHADPTALAAAVELWERIGARFERACTLLLLPDRVAEGRAELAAVTGR